MRRDTRWRASPPGFCALPDSVRSRLFSPFSRYLHIILHTAVFADRSRTRRSLRPRTQAHAPVWVVANTFRAFVPKDSAGRFPSSLLGFRLSVAGCEPASEKRRENLSRGNSSRRWKRETQPRKRAPFTFRPGSGNFRDSFPLYLWIRTATGIR